jgi:hypothetical protein
VTDNQHLLELVYIHDPHIQLGYRENDKFKFHGDRLPWNHSFIILKQSGRDEGSMKYLINQLRENSIGNIEIFIELYMHEKPHNKNLSNDGFIVQCP